MNGFQKLSPMKLGNIYLSKVEFECYTDSLMQYKLRTMLNYSVDCINAAKTSFILLSNVISF